VCDEDIFGFEVAMDDPCSVGSREPASRLRHHSIGGIGIQSPNPMEARPEVFALEVLHRDVRRMVLSEVVIEHPDDIGAIELGDRPGFIVEARSMIRAGSLARDELDRARDFQGQVMSQPDGPHTSAPELANEAEAVPDDFSFDRHEVP
jgi:hypothetical protein